MSRKSLYQVEVNGQNITSTLAPLLVSGVVSLRSGGEGDTFSLTLDDTGGKIAMPQTGATIRVALGWSDTGLRYVFDGTVDETRSTGSRDGGRLLTVNAKGFDAAGLAKQKARRNWDDSTVETILRDAAAAAGIGTVKVDPDLAQITLKYWAMIDESLLAMGQRLGIRIGGNFKVQGQTVVMSRRGATYQPVTEARSGKNLINWDVAPVLGRQVYAKVVAPYFDRAAGKWDKVEVETGLAGNATLTISPPANDMADAERQANAQAEASKRAAGAGQVTIDGDQNAVTDGVCQIIGARSGIDGTYRISAISHAVAKGSGFLTVIDLAHPNARTAADE